MTQEGKNKVAVIGQGPVAAALIEVLKNKADVVVNNNETAYKIVCRPGYFDDALSGPKTFVCKGKHEYQQVNNQWVCQCGRVL